MNRIRAGYVVLLATLGMFTLHDGYTEETPIPNFDSGDSALVTVTAKPSGAPYLIRNGIKFNGHAPPGKVLRIVGVPNERGELPILRFQSRIGFTIARSHVSLENFIIEFEQGLTRPIGVSLDSSQRSIQYIYLRNLRFRNAFRGITDTSGDNPVINLHITDVEFENPRSSSVLLKHSLAYLYLQNITVHHQSNALRTFADIRLHDNQGSIIENIRITGPASQVTNLRATGIYVTNSAAVWTRDITMTGGHGSCLWFDTVRYAYLQNLELEDCGVYGVVASRTNMLSGLSLNVSDNTNRQTIGLLVHSSADVLWSDVKVQRASFAAVAGIDSQYTNIVDVSTENSPRPSVIHNSPNSEIVLGAGRYQAPIKRSQTMIVDAAYDPRRIQEGINVSTFLNQYPGDIATAIEKAIDVAAEQHKPLIIPDSGPYVVRRTIRIDKPVTIIGAPSATLYSTSPVLFKITSSNVQFFGLNINLNEQESAFVFETSPVNPAIHQISIERTRVFGGTKAIRFRGHKASVVSNVKFSDIYFVAPKGTSVQNETKLEDVYMRKVLVNNVGLGYRIQWPAISLARMERGRLEDCDVNGFGFLGNIGTPFQNYIAPTGSGFVFRDIRKLDLIRVMPDTLSGYGLLINGGQDITLSDVVASLNWHGGIVVSDVTRFKGYNLLIQGRKITELQKMPHSHGLVLHRVEDAQLYNLQLARNPGVGLIVKESESVDSHNSIISHSEQASLILPAGSLRQKFSMTHTCN